MTSPNVAHQQSSAAATIPAPAASSSFGDATRSSPGQIKEPKLARRAAQIGEERASLLFVVEPPEIERRQGLAGLRSGHRTPRFSAFERDTMAPYSEAVKLVI
jgi:hypothetical protein